MFQGGWRSPKRPVHENKRRPSRLAARTLWVIWAGHLRIVGAEVRVWQVGEEVSKWDMKKWRLCKSSLNRNKVDAGSVEPMSFRFYSVRWKIVEHVYK